MIQKEKKRNRVFIIFETWYDIVVRLEVEAMVYYAKEGKGFWLVLFVLVILNMILFNERIAYSSYFLLLFIILAMFLNYEFKIAEDKLEYRIKLFRLTLKKRTVTPHDIKEMIFIEFSKEPHVLIKFHRGWRWRLVKFSPETFHKDVYDYAEKYGVKKELLGGYKDLVKTAWKDSLD